MIRVTKKLMLRLNIAYNIYVIDIFAEIPSKIAYHCRNKEKADGERLGPYSAGSPE